MLRFVASSLAIGLLAGCAVYAEPGYYYPPPRATYIVPAPAPAPGYYHYPRHGRGYGRDGGWHRGWR